MFHRPKTDQPGTPAQAGNAPSSPAQGQKPSPVPVAQPQQQAQPQSPSPQAQQPAPSSSPAQAPQPRAAGESRSAAPSWGADSPFSAAARAAGAEPAQDKDAARSSSPFPKDNKDDTETKTQHNKPEEKKMNIKEDQQDSRPSIPSQSAYQPAPAATQPPRAPGASYAYPGAAAPVSSAGSAYGAAADKKVASGRRLVIGEGITMSGEIEACDYLVVEGTVEAALKGASVLEIAESGTFYGTVEIDEATIAGRFEGDIVVGGRLSVTSTGSITGSIAYKELAVEAGATLDGKINPLGGSKAASIKKNDRPPMKAAKPVRNDNSDDGSQLPFAAAGSAAAE